MSLFQMLLDALRGAWGVLATGGAIAVALVGAHAALRAAEPPRLLQGFVTARPRAVLAGGSCVVAIAAVAAASGLTLPLAVTLGAALLAVMGTAFALQERLLTPHPRSAKTADGKVLITIPVILLVGATTAGLTQTVHYMWSGVSAALMTFVTGDSNSSLSPWLWAFSSTAIGVVGAAYTICRIGTEPRNRAVVAQLTSGLALLVFVLVVQSVDLSRTAAVALVVTTVVVTGVGAFQVFALYYTIGKQREGKQRVGKQREGVVAANSFFLAAWGSVAFTLGVITVSLLVNNGVHVLAVLGGVGALLLVASPVARSLPPHPESRESRAGFSEYWKAFKECRRPLVIVTFGVVILCGIPLTAAWSPLSVAGEYWELRNALFAEHVVPATGVLAVLVTLAMAAIGPKLEDKIGIMLFLGAGAIALGQGLDFIGLVEPRLGGMATIAKVFLTEGGANCFLIVVIARLNHLKDRLARTAFAVLCIAKQCSAYPFGRAMQEVQEDKLKVLQDDRLIYGAILPVIDTAGFVAAMLLVCAAGPLASYLNRLKKRQEAAESNS